MLLTFADPLPPLGLEKQPDILSARPREAMRNWRFTVPFCEALDRVHPFWACLRELSAVTERALWVAHRCLDCADRLKARAVA